MKSKAFLITAFRSELDETFKILKDICQSFNIDLVRGDTIYKDGLIIDQVIDRIKDSDLIFADITFNNPNAFYEIGVAHTLNKPTILIIKEEYKDVVPFNIRGFRYVIYTDPESLKKEIPKYFLNFKPKPNDSKDSNIDISFNIPIKDYISSIKKYVSENYPDPPKFVMKSYKKEDNYLLFQFENIFDKIVIVTDTNGVIRESKVIS